MKKSLELGGAAVILIAAVIFGILYLNPRLTLTGSPASSQKKSSTTAVTSGPVSESAGKSFATVAVATSTITIRGCKPTHQVTKISHTMLVSIVNLDDTSHVISFAPTMQYYVPSHGVKDAYFVQWTQPGIRKFSCDDNRNVGQIYVVN
ncbi:MAG TPA: hypothetical protein VF438_02265 [Candidatus Paceibacterota bacterium]